MENKLSSLDALELNKEYVKELRKVYSSLSSREHQLKLEIQAIRQRMAMKRAEEAMQLLEPRKKYEDLFAKEEKSRFLKAKEAREIPRSYLRTRSSFFNSNGLGTLPMYLSGAPHRWPSEPLPNIDTLLLRQHCHEAFHAVPLCSFSPKEREIVCNFVSKLQGTCSSTSNCTPEQWSNSIWNQINDGFGEKIQRSGFECKLWWELNANPKRRFSAWTKEEDFTLKALAEGQVDPLIVNNWIEVAKQMPFPGRPPVHCLIRYQTKLNEYMVNRQFTPEEDEMLQEAVQVFGERWAVIADLMDGRVADQLRTRWTRSIAPGIRAGKFSTEEDRRLVLAIYSHYCMENDLDDTSNGFDADKIEWHEIVPHIPGRTAISLRERFVNSLNPQVNMKKFTKEEDDTLLQLVHEADLLNEHGVWSRIAAQLDNRKDNQVWRRWKALAPIEYEQFLKRKRQNQSLPEIFSRPTKRRRGKLKHNRVIFFDAEQKEQEDEVQDQEEEEEI